MAFSDSAGSYQTALIRVAVNGTGSADQVLSTDIVRPATGTSTATECPFGVTGIIDLQQGDTVNVIGVNATTFTPDNPSSKRNVCSIAWYGDL